MITEIIKNAHQANQQLNDLIVTFTDKKIVKQLKGLPEIITTSLNKIENSYQMQLKSSLQTEMERICSLIESRKGFVESEGGNCTEKDQAKELLNNISTCYVNLYHSLNPSASVQPVARWHENRLRLEQEAIFKKQNIAIAKSLKKLLKKIKEMAARDFSVPNQCYISYAQATETTSTECWVKQFLTNLREHLCQAGVNALLDIPIGGNVYQHMYRIRESNCVIIVGTESLFVQHEAGIGDICNELVLINQNRIQQKGRTLPILLSGCFDKSFPAYFSMYIKMTDWRERSYIANLKEILATIYEIGTDHDDYCQLWQKFDQQYEILMTGFPEKAVNKILTKEKKLKAEKEELAVQQALDLFYGNENKIKGDHKNQSSVSNQAATFTWEMLIDCAKAKYRKNNKIKTTLDDARCISDCYVNLAIVKEIEQKDKVKNLAKKKVSRENLISSYEEIHGTKTSILAQDIFEYQEKNPVKRQLILGRAGIGKSVLCQYFAYQWAQAGWWNEEPFKLLVWIPLRFLTNNRIYPKDKKEITLGKVFYELYKVQLREYFPTFEEKQWIAELNKLIVKHASEIFYVLDGFDEVASICQLKEKEATRQTEILCSLLTQEQIIITSRPYYIDHYLSSQGIVIDRRLENIGFIDEDIQNYVQCYPWSMLDQRDTLQNLLNQNVQIKGIAHIPINLALICRYWRTRSPADKNNAYLSLTTLYEKLIADLLYEYLGTVSDKGDIDFKDECGAEILESEAAQPILQFLEKLAFLQMQEDTLIISKERINYLLEEFKRTYENWAGFKKILEAGLLVSSDDCEKHFEQRREHYFIHLTFQEFLAASYLARVFKQEEEQTRVILLLDKQSQAIASQPLEKFIQMHKYNLRYEIMWWFVAGRLKRHLSGLEGFFNSLLAEPRDLTETYDYLLWMKCLEECELIIEAKVNLLDKIRTRTKKLLMQEVFFYGSLYVIMWFDYLYSSLRVLEAIDILKNKDDIIATVELLKINTPERAIIGTVNLLKNEEESIRNYALKFLSSRGNWSERIITHVADLLKDREESVRNNALKILSCQSNLPKMIMFSTMALLKDEEASVKENVLKFLIQKSDLLELAITDVEALLLAIADVKDLLRDEEILVRKEALNFLIQKNTLSEEATTYVIDLLKNEEISVRKDTLIFLEGREDLPKVIIAHVSNLLKDKDVQVRLDALKILIQQSNLSEELIICVKNFVKKAKMAAKNDILKNLWYQKDLPEEIITEVEDLLENELVRKDAIEVLMQQNALSKTMVTYIVDSLKNKDVSVKKNVLGILQWRKNLSEGVFTQVTNLLQNEEISVRKEALEVLKWKNNLSKEVLIYVVSLLRNEETSVREGALQLLNWQDELPEEVVAVLANLLKNNETSVKKSVLQILKRQDSLAEKIVNYVVDLLRDKEIKVRKNALAVLVRQNNLPEEIIARVQLALKTEDATVKKVPLRFLTERFYTDLPEVVISHLMGSLEENELELREMALDILSNQDYFPEKLFDLFFKESTKECWFNYRVLNFIARSFFSILNNQELQLKLISMPTILAHVIIRNSWYCKSVAYFESDKVMVVVLSSQFKKITISDREMFTKTLMNVLKAFTIREEAVQKLRARDYSNAIIKYTTAMELDPYNLDYYYYRALGKLWSQNYCGVIEDINKVVYFWPLSSASYCIRAWAYLLDSKINLALEDVEQLLKLKKELAEAYSIYALIDFKQGNLTQAIKKCYLAIDCELPHNYSRFILARLYNYQGKKSVYQDEFGVLPNADENVLFPLIESWMRPQQPNLFLDTELTNRLSSLTLSEDKGKEEELTVPSNEIVNALNPLTSAPVYSPYFAHEQSKESEFNETSVESSETSRRTSPLPK